MVAVRAGDDSLARQALARKQEHETIATQFQQQWIAQKQAVDKLKDALRLLNNKIEEAKRKKNILIARKKRAEAQQQIANTMQGLGDTSAFDTFDRMAERIQRHLAHRPPRLHGTTRPPQRLETLALIRRPEVRAVTLTGSISGKVICQNDCQSVAPSTLAASCTSLGNA